jgi:hypothetical protein
MLDAIADFRELTDIKIAAGTTGLFMVGGGVPKNFAQDTVVCAEILGVEVEMHKYAVQITVADVRDGACSSSTLQEAASWGKVNTTYEQMVFAEATTVMPLIASDAYHRGCSWKAASPREARAGPMMRSSCSTAWPRARTIPRDTPPGATPSAWPWPRPIPSMPRRSWPAPGPSARAGWSAASTMPARSRPAS